MAEPQSGVSATVLAECPGRALDFLKGVANNPLIHAQLAAAGFTNAEYQRGWDLLHAATGYSVVAPVLPTKSPAFLAMQELDAWDEDGFRRIRSPLEHLHPAQAEHVFGDGLSASTGAAAVIGVKKLLDRLDDLANGKDRKATRKEDQAALATLSARGITAEERARLRKLVETAQTLEAPVALPTATTPEAQMAASLALYAWYKDWSSTAHSVIKKRAHLITLGLAKRRSPKKKDAGKGPPEG